MHEPGQDTPSETALRLSESRLNAVLDLVSDGLFTLDRNWRIGLFNHAAENIFGVRRDGAVGRLFRDVFPTLADSEFESRLRGVADRREGDRFEIDLIGLQGIVFAISAVPDDGGISVAISDITAERCAEIHRQLLVAELNHRVKNTLAVVQSLAVQSFRLQHSLDAARLALEGRLATLTGAHRLLTDRDWQSAPLGDVVEAAIAATADRDRFSIAGPAISLAPQTVVSFALALHELCVNAVKHGALRVPEGRVTIRWAMALDADGTERLHFVWNETGGPAAVQPATRGFGSRLLERAFTGELRGRVDLDFAPEGLRCTVDAPVPMGCI